jgi:hypothetical protein
MSLLLDASIAFGATGLGVMALGLYLGLQPWLALPVVAVLFVLTAITSITWAAWKQRIDGENPRT